MANTELSKSSATPPHRPGDIFDAMRTEMDRVFERFENGWSRFPSALWRGNGRDVMVPELDVHDDGKQLLIEADLPGVAEKDVAVTLANGTLTIKGEKKSEREDKKDNFYMSERSYGAFERTLRLPEAIDESAIEARFENGVLKVTAPKKPEAVKAEKRIEIKKS